VEQITKKYAFAVFTFSAVCVIFIFTDLRVNMANIGRKLEANPGEPKYIVTEVGVGYRMIEQ